MAAQLLGCATGDYAHIDERYQARVERCKDPNSEDRKIWTTFELCEADARAVRDEGKRNQYSLRRFFQDGSGTGGGNVTNVYILN